MSKFLRVIVLILIAGVIAPVSTANADPDTANNVTVNVGSNAGTLNSGSCKGPVIRGYCSDFMECDSIGNTILKVNFNGAEPGDVYWKAGNPYCAWNDATTVHNIAPCLKYFQVYRFYGDTVDPTQSITSSKVYLTQQCQNLSTNNISTPFKLRMFTPNPWDTGQEIEVGTPWNYKNLTITNDSYDIKSGPFTVYASDECSTIAATRVYDPKCRLTTGPSKKINSDDKSCLSIAYNTSNEFNASLRDSSPVSYQGKNTTIGKALKDIIFSIVSQSYVSRTNMETMSVNSLAWLPFTAGYDDATKPITAAEQITSVDTKYNCSSAVQYIPVTIDTQSTKSTVVGACIVGVGDNVHSFKNSNSTKFGFAHYGSEVYSTGKNKNGALALNRFLPTTLTSQSVDTGVPSQLISSTQSHTSEYLASLASTIGNGSIHPYLDAKNGGTSLTASVLNNASTSTYSEKNASFAKNVKCFSQTFIPQLLNVAPTKVCPDGTVVPANSKCPIKCPDGTIVDSLDQCEKTIPTVNCTSPCIGVTLNTPAQFVVGGSMRPQIVKATATYNLANNCGHDACRSNGNISVTLSANSTGKYTKCSSGAGGNGCSYFYEVTGSGTNSNQLTFKFFSATNPNEVIKITSSVLGHYDYMDLIPQPDHAETRGSGSTAYTVMVPTPPIERWTNNVPLTTSSQNKVAGVPVIGSIGG